MPRPAKKSSSNRTAVTKPETDSLPLETPVPSPVVVVDFDSALEMEHGSDPDDPSAELRSVLKQFQKTSKETRDRLKSVESERDELLKEAQSLREKIVQSTERERVFREQFAKFKSAIGERDMAKLEVDRMRVILGKQEKDALALRKERDESRRKAEDLERQRTAIIRASECAEKARLDALKDSEVTGRQIADFQKQLTAVRQARDSATAQAHLAREKLERAEDQIAELSDAAETARSNAAKYRDELAQVRSRLCSATTEREDTARQISDLQRELDEQRNKLIDLAQEKSATDQVDQTLRNTLDEARRQIASVSEERDIARQKIQESFKAVEELGAKLQSSTDQLAATKEMLATMEETRRQNQTLAGDLDIARLATAEAQEKLKLALDNVALHASKNAGIKAEFEAATEEVITLKVKLEQLEAEQRDYVANAEEQMLTAEAQITALREELSRTEKIIGEQQEALHEIVCRAETAEVRAESLHHQYLTLQEQQEKILEKQKQQEAQRLEFIDVAARLETSQRQIVELSAQLAEARLQVKFAMSRNGASGRAASERIARSVATLAAETAADVEPPVLAVEFTERQAREDISAMRKCHQDFTRNPRDLLLLNELHCLVESFGNRSGEAGHKAIKRIADAVSDFALKLYRDPEKVTPSTLKTISSVLDFFAAAIKTKELGKLRDPLNARVLVVDNEADSAQAITLALEAALLQAQFVLDGKSAVTTLSAKQFDLILLDVKMPDQSGFTLCEDIRRMPTYQRVPVIFVTGWNTSENRVQSAFSGGNDFVAKPFNLQEIGIKAMLLLLKSSLGIE